MTDLETTIGTQCICLGTAVFGSEIPQDTSYALMDTYAELGGTILDTAHIYAAWLPNGWGASERTMGAWVRSRRVRARMTISTKGAHPPMADMAHGRCRAADLRQDLAESLDRLKMDVVDVYWLHRDDEAVPVEEIVETMAGLVREGLIRSYGASNWTVRRIEAANLYAEKRGLPGFAANQPGWAFADYAPGPSPVGGMLYLDEIGRQWHARHGLPVFAYSAQARGFFGEANQEWARGGFVGEAPRAKEYDYPEGRRRLRAAMDLAEAKGCTAVQIALAYLLHQPFPVYPIVGTGKVERLREAMGAQSVALSETDLALLSRG